MSLLLNVSDLCTIKMLNDGSKYFFAKCWSTSFSIKYLKWHRKEVYHVSHKIDLKLFMKVTRAFIYLNFLDDIKTRFRNNKSSVGSRLNYFIKNINDVAVDKRHHFSFLFAYFAIFFYANFAKKVATRSDTIEKLRFILIVDPPLQ